MEALVPYIIPISLAVFCGGILLITWLYIRLRICWQEKCILDLNYDGWKYRNDPAAKTIFNCIREEKEHDRKLKEKAK